VGRTGPRAGRFTPVWVARVPQARDRLCDRPCDRPCDRHCGPHRGRDDERAHRLG